MEKKYFEEFIKIFMHLKNAALILSGDFYRPRIEQEIIDIEQIVKQLAEINSVIFKNIFDEIEQNLYNHPVSREIYLTNILRAFIDIAPYLNIDVVKEYCIEFGKQSVKIGDRTYPNSLDILHKTLIIREAWRNHGWDETPITIPEKYAILCYRAFWYFFYQLDKMSNSFNLHLESIQKKLDIHVFETSATLEQEEFKKPKLSGKQIFFDSTETIDSLFQELKGYFPGKETELRKALNGERLNELLIFPHNANKFIEVFRRLKYNGKLINNYTEIKDWICLNFVFRYKKGKVEKTQTFKEDTVYDTLKGKAGTEPTKKQRILQDLDWLPYKSKSQIDRETEKEKLQ